MSKKIEYRDPERVENLLALRDCIMEARADVEDTELINDLETVEKRAVTLTQAELRKPPRKTTTADIEKALSDIADAVDNIEADLCSAYKRLDDLEADT